MFFRRRIFSASTRLTVNNLMTISNTSPLSELERLERHISDLRVQPAPSTQLIDALNALAKLLSSVDIERALTASKEAHTLSYLLRHHAGVAVSLARLSWLHLEVHVRYCGARSA